MSEDITPGPSSVGESNEETRLAESSAGSATSYNTINNHIITPEEARAALTGIKPSLSYFETAGICLVVLIVPVLLNPVIGCKPTISMDHFLVQALSITLAYIIAAFICGIFAELHHYYSNCSGIVSVAKSVLGSVLYYFAIACTVTAVLLEVSDNVARLSDLIDRQSEYAFDRHTTHDWPVKIGILSLLLVLVIYLTSLLGVLLISRIAAFLALLSFSFSFVIGGFGIIHKVYGDVGKYTLLFSKIMGEHPLQGEEHPPTLYIDSGLHSYIQYLITPISQMLVITLLLPLTEDNKLKKYRINIIGTCAFAAVFVASLFLNLTLSHIISDQDVFIDQAGLTMSMPPQLVLTISVIVGLATVCRAILLLYSVSRILCHMVVTQEETGITFIYRLCKILKMPMFVNGVQCIIIAVILFINKRDITLLALVSLSIYICTGAVCHILHRYSSPESCQNTPLLESFGSWRPLRVIKVLIAVAIIMALLLCTADVAGDYIDLPTHASKQVYALVRGLIALLFIAAVSIIASFNQKLGIAGVYRWILWTPLVPACALLVGCVAVVYNWFWGVILLAVLLLLTANIAIFNKLVVKICCRPSNEDLATE